MIYDLAIIGAGPGGYVAAIRAAQAGLKTALIEKEHVGGTCLNRGCIPTKSLAYVAHVMSEIDGLSGIFPSPLGGEGQGEGGRLADLAKIVERKDKIVAGLRSGIQQLLKARKIDLIRGTAKFLSNNEIMVVSDPSHQPPATSHCISHQSLATSHCIIATGSTWRPLPNLAPDGKFILTSDEVLDMKALPKKLVIVGGGVIGCEFASIMRAFGSEVAIVEVAEQLLPMEDATIARQLAASFKKREIKIFTKTTVSSAKDGKVTLSTNEVLDAEKVLVSVGRKPFTEGLGLEAIGVEMKNGFILTDGHMKTNVSTIYAIGDVATPKSGGGKPALAHVASYEGTIAAHNVKCQMSNDKRKAANLRLVDYSVVPRPIFTDPEIGCVGMTEKQLKEKGISYKTGRFAYAALSKAVCDSSAEGMMLAYVGGDEKILGACCMGSHATDICAEVTLAMKHGLTVKDVAETIHAHPTYSEIVPEALEDAFGRAVHKVGR